MPSIGSASGAAARAFLPVAAGVKMAAQAFTIRYVPVVQVKGTVGDYMEMVEPVDVIVLNNDGHRRKPG
jgi:regulator of RNase E activity RraA